MKLLKQGMCGEDVKFLQSELARVGHNIKADGDFGPGTLNAVKAFQKKHNLGADGVVGNGTWEVLLFDGRPRRILRAKQARHPLRGPCVLEPTQAAPHQPREVRSRQPGHTLSQVEQGTLQGRIGRICAPGASPQDQRRRRQRIGKLGHVPNHGLPLRALWIQERVAVCGVHEPERAQPAHRVLPLHTQVGRHASRIAGEKLGFLRPSLQW